MKHRGNNQGFTLIELIAVLIIVGLLAAVALPRFADLSDSAEAAVVASVAAGLSAGAEQYRAFWLVQGSPGDGSTGREDLTVGDFSVRYRNGYVVNVNDNSGVPAGTPNRGSANTRIFHLFLAVPPGPIITRNSDETGWVMLANGDCAAVTRPRCWEYRVNGAREARITYASGEDGRIIVD